MLVICFAFAFLLLPSAATTSAQSKYLQCDAGPIADGGAFCKAVYEARAKLLSDPFLAWWVEWADERRVLVEQRPEFPLGQWGAWPYRNTIAVAPGITGDIIDASNLLHEITHLMDDEGSDFSLVIVGGVTYPQSPWTCSRDPWSHERVYFWQMVAIANLTAKDDNLRIQYKDYLLWLYQMQSSYEVQVRYYTWGTEEPCRRYGALETAPHGIAYSWIKPLLGWWD